MSNNVSRRTFLEASGTVLAGAAAMGAVSSTALAEEAGASTGMPVGPNGMAAGPDAAGLHSWEIAPDPIAEEQISDEEDCDVLVIGAGLAGTCATMAALEEGVKVITIDKTNGASPVGRGVHIAGFHTKVQQKLVEEGLLEEPDYSNVVRRWINWAQGRVKEPLLWEFAHKSGACFYYKGPDYTEYPVTHIFYQADKYEETVNFTFYQGAGVGDVYGNAALMPVLYDVVEQKGGAIRWSTKCERLVRGENGPVTGAIVSNEDGSYTKINAKSVVIAAGDYAADEEMLKYYSPMTAYAMDARWYMPPNCDTGDMHKQAVWIGGAMQKSEPHAAVMHLDFGAASYGFLHVNWEGKRYKNEDVNTQSKSVTKALQTHKEAFCIYDSHGLEQVKEQIDNNLGGGLQWGQLTQPVGAEYNLEAQKLVLEGEVADGKTYQADTLEGLAAQMGVPAENLVAAVNRYNELCDLGKDLDFGKRPEVMGKIVEPPFYAGKLEADLLTMCGGLRTDLDCHVLDSDDQPIEGLYVCGSTAGEFFGAGDYPTYVPGIGHGRCVTFGRIAGINAAGGNANEEIESLEI